MSRIGKQICWVPAEVEGWDYADEASNEFTNAEENGIDRMSNALLEEYYIWSHGKIYGTVVESWDGDGDKILLENGSELTGSNVTLRYVAYPWDISPAREIPQETLETEAEKILAEITCSAGELSWNDDIDSLELSEREKHAYRLGIVTAALYLRADLVPDDEILQRAFSAEKAYRKRELGVREEEWLEIGTEREIAAWLEEQTGVVDENNS